jgi:cytochrome P450
VDAVAGKGECEFVEAVAVPLPAQVFLTMFGLPQADRDKLIAWKDRILGNSAGTGATEAAPQATAEAAAETWEGSLHPAGLRAEMASRTPRWRSSWADLLEPGRVGEGVPLEMAWRPGEPIQSLG